MNPFHQPRHPNPVGTTSTPSPCMPLVGPSPQGRALSPRAPLVPEPSPTRPLSLKVGRSLRERLVGSIPSTSTPAPRGRPTPCPPPPWYRDPVGTTSTSSPSIPFYPLSLLLILLLGCNRHPDAVVVYCAQDQVYAEPILRAFENETGLDVRAVYDSEAVKTVGLANRLLAEKSRPVCDLFWGNEEMRARQLAQLGVFRDLKTFGQRSRRIVVNTNHINLTHAPQSLLDLTNTAWQGRVALAYPLFGTTSTHFHALRQLWGEPAFQQWCRALIANKPLLLDGNSGVVKAVGDGRAWIGLTDSDDIAAGQREGLPVQSLPPGPETLWIPNVAALVSGSPNPKAAERLAAFLPSQVPALIDANALESTTEGNERRPGINVDWDALLRDMTNTTRWLEKVFLK